MTSYNKGPISRAHKGDRNNARTDTETNTNPRARDPLDLFPLPQEQEVTPESMAMLEAMKAQGEAAVDSHREKYGKLKTAFAKKNIARIQGFANAYLTASAAAVEANNGK